MKKILVLVCSILVAAACTPQPAGNNTTSNANAAREAKSAMPSEADLTAKEKAAWDAFKRKDADAFKKLLASEYIEVLDSGTHDTASSLEGMKDFELSDVSFSDWKMTTIDKDAAILTYSVTVKGKYKGEALPVGPYREASAYVNRNGEWLAIYYQETVAKNAPPPPAPSPTTNKTPATSPAAKPAETGSDPIANEKIVWDLFRSRNYDGFAALLAPEFVEVESNAVLEKAAAVKGVQTFDASQFQLGDWKSVKFDAAAALVTYTVTSSGPHAEKEYHSTIWVNRDGKWLGLFHQGTPAATPTPKK